MSYLRNTIKSRWSENPGLNHNSAVGTQNRGIRLDQPRQVCTGQHFHVWSGGRVVYGLLAKHVQVELLVLDRAIYSLLFELMQHVGVELAEGLVGGPAHGGHEPGQLAPALEGVKP